MAHVGVGLTYSSQNGGKPYRDPHYDLKHSRGAHSAAIVSGIRGTLEEIADYRHLGASIEPSSSLLRIP